MLWLLFFVPRVLPLLVVFVVVLLLLLLALVSAADAGVRSGVAVVLTFACCLSARLVL